MKDLDKYIAEKVMGWEVEWLEMTEYYYRVKGGKRTHRIAMYTTDLNLAFEAAKKFGLWKRRTRKRTLGLVHGVYAVYRGSRTNEIVGQHKNAATAICLAIHRLKTGKDWE